VFIRRVFLNINHTEIVKFLTYYENPMYGLHLTNFELFTGVESLSDRFMS
jgi:hypothetical protein